MNNRNYAVGLWALGGSKDRYTTYRDPVPLEVLLDRACSIDGVKGIEIGYPFPVAIDVLAKELKDRELSVCSVIGSMINGPMFKYGSLSNPDEAIRSTAISVLKEMADAASYLGCGTIAVWPGQDGFDYPFQVDYQASWRRFADGIAVLARHRPEIRVAIEYKMKEPRTHSLMATIAKSVLMCEKTGCSNTGIVLDFGHSLAAGESPAESVEIALMLGRLFHIHMNDNYRYWDDDMIVGTVHVWETMEFLYCLEKMAYDGWISLDMFPYREDPVDACRSAIANLRALQAATDRLDREELQQAQKRSDVVRVQALLREALFDR
jgi:xylose isomerase